MIEELYMEEFNVTKLQQSFQIDPLAIRKLSFKWKILTFIGHYSTYCLFVRRYVY